MRFAARRLLFIFAVALFAPLGEVQALAIRLQPGHGLPLPVIEAVERGARLWERALADPVTVEIEVAMADLGDSRMLAKTLPVLVEANYAEIREAIAAEGSVAASLHLSDEFDATLPPGFVLGNTIEGTKANFKALGLVGLDEGFGASDGSILLSSTASFDFDPSNGITAGQIDLQGLVAHELAHVLGFVSAVDWIDNAMADPAGPRSVDPTPLDFFRFSADQAPIDAASFASTPRNLVPGTESVFSTGGPSGLGLSTGQQHGDGRQASHWKDDELAGGWIGVADPTIDLGMALSLTQADVYALEAVGWNAVPEPSIGTLMGLGLFLLGALSYRSTALVFSTGGYRGLRPRQPGEVRVSCTATETLQSRERRQTLRTCTDAADRTDVAGASIGGPDRLRTCSRGRMAERDYAK